MYNNNTIILEWDENKREENIRKHGIDFSCAIDVLTDDNVVVYEDMRKEYGEARYIAYGEYKHNVFCVCYTMRGRAHRIISLRRTHKNERRKHYDNN